jgi:hypothetical protein
MQLMDVPVMSKTTILMPHPHSAVADLYSQLRNAITVGNLATMSATSIVEEEKKKNGGTKS